MATIRRRLIRPAPAPPTPTPPRQLQKLRSRLQNERQALARWQSRLKRAFNATLKRQKRISRLERQVTPWEER